MSGGVWRKCSSSPISTIKGLPAMLGAFYCGDTRLLGKRFSFSTPVSCADSPCQGHTAFAPASAGGFAASTFLWKSRWRSATAADAAHGLRPLIVPHFVPHFLGRFRTRTWVNLCGVKWRGKRKFLSQFVTSNGKINIIFSHCLSYRCLPDLTASDNTLFDPDSKECSL